MYMLLSNTCKMYYLNKKKSGHLYAKKKFIDLCWYFVFPCFRIQPLPLCDDVSEYTFELLHYTKWT